MLRDKRISTWLILCLLGCLFILAVHSPASWRKAAHRTSLADLLGSVADSPTDEEANSVPLAPDWKLPLRSDDVWVVAEAAAPLASRPQLDMEIVEPSLQRVALIPDPARPLPGERLDSPLVFPSTTTSNEKKDPFPDEITQPREQPEETDGQKSVEEPAQPDWPLPLALFEQLDRLSSSAPTRQWAVETRRAVESLIVSLSSQPEHEAGREADEFFDRLRSQSRQAERLVAALHEDNLAESLRRCNYALQRRLDLWRPISGMVRREPASQNANDTNAGDKQLALVVQKADAMLGNSAQAAAWREFLLIDALRGLAGEEDKLVEGKSTIINVSERKQSVAVRHRAVAGEVLSRVARSNLSEEQRQFLKRDPFLSLGTELRRISDDGFDPRELARILELYESGGLPGDARLLADECLRLAVSRDVRQKALGEQLAVHYCNPNIRMALSADLLNRLTPKQPAELQAVRDTMLGNPVYGRSLTETDVAIRLIPDPHRLLLTLEVSGDVASITNSTSGPATFRNASTSRYVARKPLEITMAGIVLQPAEVVDVQNDVQLQSVWTDFDAIPLIGAIAQGVAISGHDSKRSDVKRELSRKVAWRAKQRIDADAESRLNETSERLKNRLIEPMAKLDIVPEMIGSETTEERLVMQLRLASNKQLAAHTYRPWAPADSLMSLQIHQTAVNNVLNGLKLDGVTLTLAELKQHVADKLNLPSFLEGDDNHDDVKITFAPRDAVRIECRDGRIAVTLAIATLEKEPRAWHDFQVRAYYSVRLDGLSAELVRNDSIRMVGRRVSTSSQLAIRSIFVRVFSRGAALQLVPDRIRNNPEMSDQMVTQFEIEDGWVAMALGPRR